MTNPDAMRHNGEELQDLLDGRLDEAQRAVVEAHVAQCARCRRELDGLRWARDAARTQATTERAPDELQARVRAALGAAGAPAPRARIPRRAWLAGTLAAAALLVVFMRGHRPAISPAMIAADFTTQRSGSVALGVESSDPPTVEAYFERSGIDFPTRVFDLGMMRYQLVGGRVNRIAGRPAALFVYRGADDTWVVCQMYEGEVTELPPTTEVRENNGITFHVYRSGELTLVFWQEGDVACVLTSDAPAETVVQLAFAKAVRVD